MPTKTGKPTQIKSSTYESTIDIDGDRKAGKALLIDMKVNHIDAVAVGIVLTELRHRWGPNFRKRLLLMSSIAHEVEMQTSKQDATPPGDSLAG